MKHIIIVIVWLFVPFFITKGESISDIRQLFDSIKECRIDSIKIELNKKLNNRIDSLLQDPTSFNHSFDSLPYLGKIYSDDHLVKIYTWSFPLEDKTFQYGGFIQYNSKGKITTTPLIIPSMPQLPPEDKKIDAKHWYGALYYKILKVKKKRETYYIALGWSGLNAATDFKVIEPLQFSKNGQLQAMGKMVFKETGKKACHRIVMEYNSEGKVTLDYNPHEGLIIFDHLSPIEPIYTGIRSYYGPDFTYDAFKLKKGDWYFTENIDARNR